ncbi:conjugal transfer protein TraJ, partial [Escherichia coli]|nr:conjugal transfer protein TraJ [Escherichia coli]
HNAIARILNISISTSKKQASLICDYFSVSNKDELIILLYNKKFIYYLYEKAMCIINTR